MVVELSEVGDVLADRRKQLQVDEALHESGAELGDEHLGAGFVGCRRPAAWVRIHYYLFPVRDVGQNLEDFG